MINWEPIKNEYVTGNSSYARLAEKYGVSVDTVKAHGAKEGWRQLRADARRERWEQAMASQENDAQERKADIQETADWLLEWVRQSLNAPEPKSASELKSLAGVLKSVQDIHMIRSPWELREQEAKIAALEKQTSEEQGTVEVALEGELKDYAQ